MIYFSFSFEKTFSINSRILLRMAIEKKRWSAAGNWNEKRVSSGGLNDQRDKQTITNSLMLSYL